MSSSTLASAVVSSKGQVTLPAALRTLLGLQAGSRILFEARGSELVIKPDLPLSTYYGLLKDYNITDTEIPKEVDRSL